MADLRDQYGNPIQLTDEFGNPVQLRDEHGNPMHITGVATAPGVVPTSGLHDTSALATGGGGAVGAGAGHHALKDELRRSGSSSSSSSEDDGEGGRRKKGLKQKIKEKLGVSKQQEDPTAVGADKHQAAAATTTLEAGGVQAEHEKKSIMEKIKETLPGHPTM